MADPQSAPAPGRNIVLCQACKKQVRFKRFFGWLHICADQEVARGPR